MNSIVFDYPQRERINVMPHPPYSPDPSDNWLFGTLKRSLVSYPDIASLARVITKELHSLPIEEYRKTFQKWVETLQSTSWGLFRTSDVKLVRERIDYNL